MHDIRRKAHHVAVSMDLAARRRRTQHGVGSNVVARTAPEEALPQMKKLSRKKMAKVMPGKRKAVRSVSAFHWWPLKALYVMAAE